MLLPRPGQSRSETTGDKMGYNGHRDWNAWNVALWLFNDEALYRMMVAAVDANPGNLAMAAQVILDNTPEQTPDGALFTLEDIEDALEDWED